MRKTALFLSAVFVAAECLAQQITTLPDIVSFMATNDYRRNFIMTNNLDIVASSCTGRLERSTCKLIKASILLDY